MKSMELPSVETRKNNKKGKEKPHYKKQKNIVKFDIPTKVTDAYQTEHVFLRRMTKEQKRGLSLLFRGITYENMTLKNQREIKHPVDAVRWLLEQINDSVAE
ncbi:hypothetical protein CMK18_23860 [Candidatus Poribacteria bacterium]|nr:hypothetical protein [Candidatus Poribacteria bacterium]|tara:strand:+ start:256 stop:561 length:306 start_codon:yes stop_codon:yes gene_type:complete